ncbi:MAG: hypothetical protein KF688_01155 [Pirellulales bacterium]|nr:hypothetical protein [Pirellulales bacterium]
MPRALSAFTLSGCFISLLAVSNLYAQEAKGPATFADRLENYRQSMLEEQKNLLGSDPKLAEFVAVAEQARSLVNASDPAPGQPTLLKLHQEFSTRFNELLQSNLGRYVATEQEAVQACLRLEEVKKGFSPEAIAERYRRLGKSIEVLQGYNATLGEFDPENNETAKAILADATWVNDYYAKVKKQVALLNAFEQTASADAAASSADAVATKATLRQAMDAYQAEQLLEKLDQDTSAIEKATVEAEAAQRAADVEIIKKRAVVEVEAKKKLAAVARELLAAEMDFKAAEQRLTTARVRRQEQATLDAAEMERTLSGIDKEGAEQERLDAEELAARARLIKYLQSARVKQLLAPFCSPGSMAASNALGQGRRIEEIGKHPMSLSQLAKCECLASTRQSMEYLITVANDENDRPGWPVTHESWERHGETFRDIDGKKVNPCVEGQRILREHGGLLVELKMLRP